MCGCGRGDRIPVRALRRQAGAVNQNLRGGNRDVRRNFSSTASRRPCERLVERFAFGWKSAHDAGRWGEQLLVFLLVSSISSLEIKSSDQRHNLRVRCRPGPSPKLNFDSAWFFLTKSRPKNPYCFSAGNLACRCSAHVRFRGQGGPGAKNDAMSVHGPITDVDLTLRISPSAAGHKPHISTQCLRPE